MIDRSAEDFLKDIWHRRPCFMPSVCSVADHLVSPDELAGLAGEAFVESRIIRKDDDNNWIVEHGPFAPDAYRILQDQVWTLLVQDADKFVPRVADMLTQIDFLPHYWLDDIMISYATTDASVGAHTDNYDVFLVQTQGSRRWQVESTPRLNDEFVPNQPLRLLDSFYPDQSFDAHAGDVLYIPPQFAHHGVALDDDCMTYSIGLRAPSTQDMLLSYMQYLSVNEEDEILVHDPAPQAVPESGRIIDAHADLVLSAMQSIINKPKHLKRWFGQFLSEPKFRLDTENETHRTGRILVRDENCRAYYNHDATGVLLFVQGDLIPVSTQDLDLVKKICNNRRVPLDRDEIPDWMKGLIDAGHWYWD